MSTLDSSKADAGRSENTPFSGSHLGIDAKYSAGQQNQGFQPFDPLTGEVLQTEKQYCSVTVRLERYILQSAARKLLNNSKVTRVNNCLRVPSKIIKFQQRPAGVQVYKSLKHKTCFYGGLQTCASVWVCAVCAAKISERRKCELQKAIEQYTATGGEVLFLTLTNPHYQGDKLVDLLKGQAKALYYFNGDRASRELFKSMGHIGSVRALEVTHGRLREFSNGWHPHYHILLFVKSGLDLAALENALWLRWVMACSKAMPGSRLPDQKHGVKLENGTKSASYASKWGLESEMTKGHLKKAINGETPFDLLRAYAYDDDKQAGALFREFAETFKGKRQLHWSHGLKAMFNLKEVTDGELAEQQDDDASILGTIELEDWKLVLKFDLRGEILELGRVGEWEPIERLLANLKNKIEVIDIHS
jgi:hypothetical protein